MTIPFNPLPSNLKFCLCYLKNGVVKISMFMFMFTIIIINYILCIIYLF